MNKPDDDTASFFTACAMLALLPLCLALIILLVAFASSIEFGTCKDGDLRFDKIGFTLYECKDGQWLAPDGNKFKHTVEW